MPEPADRRQEPEVAPAQVTHALRAMRDGARTPADLLPLVYDHLRGIARRRLGEAAGQTLQATALVHEAWLKVQADLVSDLGDDGDRAQFLAAAARAMRDIVVDRARARQAEKRGGGRRADLDVADFALAETPPIADVLALHEALTQLATRHPRAAQIVELRFFAGLPMGEIAQVLGLSERTAHLDWRFARAWLQDHVGGEPG